MTRRMTAEPWLGFGQALLAAARYDEAADAFSRAAALDTNLPGVHGGLGDCLLYQCRPGEAVACYRRELCEHPDRAAPFLGNFARALADTGQTAEAVATYRRAVALHPDDAALHSGLLLLLHYDPATTDAELRAEHEAWVARHAAPLAKNIRPRANDRTAGRRLRIGYVSPDLWGHVVGTSILPVLEHHDRERFEVFCYSDTPVCDEVNARLERLADVWRGPWLPGIAGNEPRYFWRSDATLAEQIRLDRVDVLVDLAGHMPRNRMLTFARRPAPVQITYLGYAASTGLPQMDYRITDAHMDPPGRPSDGPEQLLRLPNCYWAYRPAAAGFEAGPPPHARNGFVTFGSFNSSIKVNDAVIAAWARILNEVPASRLLCVMRGGEGNAHVRQQFESRGVAPDRLRLLPMQPPDAYFQLFNEVDLSLDPFPYNGGVSSLNSLWMGVPFVTLAGTRAVGRAGLSILTHVGLTDLVARDVEQYVALTVRLARDPARLATLRGALRERLRQSPLMDERRFTRDLEAQYAGAWEAWRTIE